MQNEHSVTPRPARRRVAPPVGVCENCGIQFVPKRQTTGRFCSAPCYQAWWKERGQREAGAKGLRRLDELRAQGRDPRSTEQSAWKRKMAFRNTAITMLDDEVSDDEAWAERGAYWQLEADPDVRTLTRSPGKARKPLVLAGHGVRLRIDYGALVARSGFTHHPQKVREYRFFPGDPRLPSRLVLVEVDGYVTFDVVSWLSRQGIPLVVLDWRGRIVSVFGQETTGVDSELRRSQIDARDNGAGLRLATHLIRGKLEGCRRTLAVLPDSDANLAAAAKLKEILSTLHEHIPADVQELRLLEAQAANRYFAAWRGIDLPWKGTARRPVPPEWRRVGARQTLMRPDNRHASHPMNALVNYGYGILESQIRIACAETGLDPSIGFLHANHPGRAALVFDLMEPLRPKVDRAVLEFVKGHAFSAADFAITDEGACRLHPQLARALVKQVGVLDCSETVGWAASLLHVA